MLLKKLSIHNFKSLRKVCFEPSPLSVIVGTNASGKTNFASAIHFLSEAYSLGLEKAVVNAGGYENIAYKKQKSSIAPIEFSITTEISFKKIIEHYEEVRKEKVNDSQTQELINTYKFLQMDFTHEFTFKSDEKVSSDFRVINENYKMALGVETPSEVIYKIKRLLNNKIKIEAHDILNEIVKSDEYQKLTQNLNFVEKYSISNQELLLKTNRFNMLFDFIASVFSGLVSSYAVYQLSTFVIRVEGVASPNPRMRKQGGNLPAMVDWLKRHYPAKWNQVLDGMREIMPTLKDIKVEHLHNNLLGLFFKEEGVRLAWNSENVSDGTIRALAMLVAAADPRNTLLVIEEPENSFHPWVLRTVLESLRKLSKNKNVVLTTHSPILVDMMRPEEVWVMYREKGESHLERLTRLDPTIQEKWTEGKTVLSNYLDAGFIGQAVPGGVF